MRKIFTLLFIATLLSSKIFAQCNPAIPANAVVVLTNQTTSSATYYWVCNGATLDGSGGSKVYYLETGATLTGVGSSATVYAKPGSTVNRSGGSGPTIYYVNAGDILSAGGSGPVMNQCASITYDYTSAPPNGCPICTSAGTPATSISSSSGGAICQGKPSTLSQVGGTLGPNAQWKWYTGSCGGTLIDSGAAIVVSPSSTTTYYLRGEDTCNTSCVQTTLSPTGVSVPVIAGDPTPLCAGQPTTLSVINNPCFGNCFYSWSDGSTGITVVVTPTSATTYTATVKNDCGDSSYSSITIPNCSTTGMALHSSMHGISLHPNPSHGTFVLSMSSAWEKPTIKIFDVIGNEIPFTSNERPSPGYKNEISIGNRPPGIYFIKMESKGETVVSKLIIKAN